MSINNLINRSLLGLVLAFPLASQAPAQGLTVMRGTTSSNISVAVNRAIVIKSDSVFSEVSVANPAIADIATLSEDTIYVLGKLPGRTTLTIFGADGSLVSNVDIRVIPDIAEFKERLSEILPGEPIQVRTANNGIVLSGTVSGARKVAQAIELAKLYVDGGNEALVTNLMMVGGTQQVMLQVRFAEMQRSVAKSLDSSVGITTLGNAAFGSGNLTGGGAFGGLATPTSNERAGAFSFTFGGGGLAVNVLLEALETKGMVRTLAEPNVVAISGQSAEFFAGGEYPVVTLTDGDREVQYKRFGVTLAFKPTVIDGNLIRLELDTEVSSLDRNIVGAQGVFGFKTRSTKTSVEMRDGQSFAIAGLLQDDFDDTVGQVPWLGDIPILGSLFRSSDFQRQQSELVIIITPHLVTPTSSDALSMATNNMRIPTEEELFLLGATEGSSFLGSSGEGIQGSYGYVLE